jgi:hypothetical protein
MRRSTLLSGSSAGGTGGRINGIGENGEGDAWSGSGSGSARAQRLVVIDLGLCRSFREPNGIDIPQLYIYITVSLPRALKIS